MGYTMNGISRVLFAFAIAALSLGAAAHGPARAQSSWQKVDCEKSAIRHPELTACEQGPVASSNNAGVFAENWAISGQTKDGSRARLNLYKVVQFNTVSRLVPDDYLEKTLKTYYRSAIPNIPEDVELQAFETYKGLKFRTEDSSRTECVVFHKWGTLHTPTISTSGYTHWVRGYLCAPPGKDLAPDAVDQLLTAVEVKAIF